APRHVGAKMIVTRGESFGTVGGGAVEHAATSDARELLRLRRSETRRYDLTPEGGIQPCGGAVEIFFECVSPLLPVVFFGAGHIAEKLVPMLPELGYEVTLVDERAERLDLPAFSCAAERIAKLPAEVLPTVEFSDELSILCLTHAHIHDEEIVGYCLNKPYRYLGLISSRKKWALFCEGYRSRGVTEEQLSRVSTPVGLDIGAESPLEIAVAIAAELIQLKAKPEDFAAGVGRFKK
ncbi:MAG TPA: XdhC/CoxI family protein, partial [bacterium]|nr:XdhC/CoxI family protein [bacterium]